MSVSIVGSTTDDLALALNAMESSLKIGERALLELYTETLPTDVELAELYLNASAAGFHIKFPTAQIKEGVPTTDIILTKGSPVWAALIPLIPTLLIGGLVAFGLTRIETISKALMPLILTAVGGLIILVAVLRRPAERVATRYLERGGQVPRLPKTTKKGKATREDVRVEVWKERDRLHIGIQDKKTGDYLVSWWDDEARQMFEDGFFKRGGQLQSSVLDYAESIGILALSNYQKKVVAAR